MPGDQQTLTVDPWPRVDFERFGPVDRRVLSRIRRRIIRRLVRNWVMIPHVTHHDRADITELERLRRELNQSAGAGEAKLTIVAFVIAASVVALREFPQFNASLGSDELVLRHYYNIGVATDTPSGLLVPVLRDAGSKGVRELAAELASLAGLAREGALVPEQMAGGTFTISSLGGIGGLGFTPIINAPEVAILGVTRAAVAPVWTGVEFVPRLMLPLSLSYDHRVIDGADAARFTVRLAELLSEEIPAELDAHL